MAASGSVNWKNSLLSHAVLLSEQSSSARPFVVSALPPSSIGWKGRSLTLYRIPCCCSREPNHQQTLWPVPSRPTAVEVECKTVSTKRDIGVYATVPRCVMPSCIAGRIVCGVVLVNRTCLGCVVQELLVSTRLPAMRTC
jgi:hypothetical protein